MLAQARLKHRIIVGYQDWRIVWNKDLRKYFTLPITP